MRALPARGHLNPTTMNHERQTERVALDRVFDVLSHPYRRRILTLLEDRNPREDEEFSPEEIAAEDVDLELFTRELYHSHLPKLDEAGYIEWDREADVIRHGPQFDEVEPLISLMRDHPDELPEDWP